MPSPRVLTAYARDPSGLTATDANVPGTNSTGDPSGFWLSTSQSRAVPSAAAVTRVRPPSAKPADVMRAVWPSSGLPTGRQSSVENSCPRPSYCPTKRSSS